jgi:hypothetical protein
MKIEGVETILNEDKWLLLQAITNNGISGRWISCGSLASKAHPNR